MGNVQNDKLYTLFTLCKCTIFKPIYDSRYTVCLGMGPLVIYYNRYYPSMGSMLHTFHTYHGNDYVHGSDCITFPFKINVPEKYLRNME